MLGELGSIRLKDLEIFIEVARARSIREVARRMDTTSGQISKAIQGLETRLGTRLFRRSVSGVLLTSQGAELQTIVQELLSNSEKIAHLTSGRDRAKFAKVLAVAGTSYLNTHFTTALTCRLAKEWSETVFRFLDLPPDQIIPVGLRNGFDIAVHFGALAWPSTWTTKTLGKAKWTLCTRIDHPLPKRPSLKQILEYPFVVPTYWTAEGLVRGNDQFPIPFSRRKVGFETSTADAAVPILLETNQIAYLPGLLAQTFTANKLLREIRIDEIPIVTKELFLSAKAESVPAKIFAALATEMSAALG